MSRQINPRSTRKADTEIGNRIRMRRNELKISQAELGEALGVSFQQIQKYEKGKNRVGAGRLVQIAKALDCDVLLFLPNPERKSAGYAIDGFMATKDGVTVAQAFIRIADDNVRHLVARFVDDISRVTMRRTMQAAE